MAKQPDLTLHLPEPRPAVAIAHITGKRIEVVLWQLRELEQAGLVKHETDETGVMRWVRTQGRPQ